MRSSSAVWSCSRVPVGYSSAMACTRVPRERERSVWASARAAETSQSSGELWMVSRREGESAMVRRPSSAPFSGDSWAGRAKNGSVLDSGNKPHHCSGDAPGACTRARRARVRDAASKRKAAALGFRAASGFWASSAVSGASGAEASGTCASGRGEPAAFFSSASSALMAVSASSTRVRRSSATSERRVAGRRTRVMGTSGESFSASVGTTKSKNSPGASSSLRTAVSTRRALARVAATANMRSSSWRVSRTRSG